MAMEGGVITLEDLKSYEIAERYVGPASSCPTAGTYRGYTIIGCPLCSAGGVHLVQMLNILEQWDLKKLGYATPAYCHLLAEVMKVAFEDRNTYSGDPEFLHVPTVSRILLISKTRC
eukprot:SAG31_NODE_1383_length_8578_cov_3.660573_4_plen_117_part_00